MICFCCHVSSPVQVVVEPLANKHYAQAFLFNLSIVLLSSGVTLYGDWPGDIIVPEYGHRRDQQTVSLDAGPLPP